jgi:hypothetical protein
MNDVVISGAFDWDRSWPRTKGSKFYCSPFRLAFSISRPVPPSVRQLFKHLGYREVTGEKNSPRFVKKLELSVDVLDEVNQFTSKYLERHVIDGQSPERYLTWEFSSNFLWRVMYYKQSLKRYGARPIG